MPEQITEEDLKNMSPEEILELQKKQCIFCHIISGKVASRKIYEDDRCIGILDINPANPGHVLLLPKEHYSIMPQLPEDLIGHIFTVVKHISHALLRALKVEGTYIFVANGIAAGQKAAHLMIHIIPRKEGDGLLLDIPEGKIKQNQLDQLRGVLVQRIGGFAGDEKKIEPEKRAEPEKKEMPVKETDLDAISALVASRGIEEKPFSKKSKKYVSSVVSKKYHVPNCPFAKNIIKAVYFKNSQEARKAGKIACECAK